MTTGPVRLQMRDENGRLTVAAAGEWTVADAAALDGSIRALDPGPRRPSQLELSGVTRVDSAGALLLLRLRDRLAADGRTVELSGIRPAHRALIERIDALGPPQSPRPAPRRPLTDLLARIGRATVAIGYDVASLLDFLGLVTVTALRTALHPRRIRAVSFASHLESAGFDALPIVGLLSFLIGIVVAYQGAEQLRRFGAEIFTVDLLGISVLREMGVLLTAIVVAGRSGSAFAAQIGTMQVNQEIDALRTLGLDPVEVLVLPRVFALAIAMPLLAVYADMMGLIGGALMSAATLHIAPAQFAERLRETVTLSTFWIGVVKAPVFGLLIALTGCREGLAVSGSAESVGRRTTRAVVVGIFLVIVADAAFSILFSVAGV